MITPCLTLSEADSKSGSFFYQDFYQDFCKTAFGKRGGQGVIPDHPLTPSKRHIKSERNTTLFVPVHVTPTPGRYRANRAGEPNTYERRIFDVLAFGTDADGHTGAMVLVGNKPEWHPAEAWTIWGSR